MKSLRNLRIPLIILLALCLLFILAYQLIYKRNIKTTETNETESIKFLLSLPIPDIESLTVESAAGDSFSIRSLNRASETKEWLFESNDKLPSDLIYSQMLLDSYIASLSNITYISKIESKPISLPDYGLDPSEYYVKIRTNSGEEYMISIGDYSIDKETIYIKMSGSDDVYLVSSNLRSLCEYTYLDFLDRGIISFSSDEVLSFSYKRKTDPIDVKLSPVFTDISTETTYSQWKFFSPFSFPASNKTSGFIESIINIQIYRFIDYDFNVDDFGLNDPEYSFSIKKTDNTEVTLFLSKLTGEYYYGYSNLSPNVFMIFRDSVSGLQIPFIEQISPSLYTEDISEIKSIEAIFPEGSILLEMDLDADEPFLSEKSEIYINKRNAKVSDSAGNSYFEVLYNSISRLRLSAIELEESPLNLKTVSIKILMKDGNSIIIDYSQKDQENYYLFIDNAYLGFVVNKSAIYGKEGTDYSEYGVWDAYQLLDEALDGQMNGTYDISEP